jgi:hypothetical protein
MDANYRNFLDEDKFNNVDIRIPHRKKVNIPGYGCLIPTFKELSAINKNSTTKHNPDNSGDSRIAALCRYISLIV